MEDDRFNNLYQHVYFLVSFALMRRGGWLFLIACLHIKHTLAHNVSLYFFFSSFLHIVIHVIKIKIVTLIQACIAT